MGPREAWRSQVRDWYAVSNSMAMTFEVGKQSETIRSLLRPLMCPHPASFYPVVLACSEARVGWLS